MKITSTQNQLVKLYASLKLKKNRELHGFFLLEGEDLLKEAYAAKAIKTILYVGEKPLKDDSIEFIEVSEEIVKKISTQVTPGKFVAICKLLENNAEKGKKVIVLDGVQDPGNGGTILRSAIAFGFDEMLLSNDSFDIYNDKFLRASKGSVFNINIKRLNLKEELLERKSLGYQIITTSVINSTSYDKFNYNDKLCLVVGNEGQGISNEIFDLSDASVHISMSDKMESLNVGVAASIIMSKIYSK